MTQNPNIAKTILEQMGGIRRLVMMTGAKNFVDHGNGVSFKFPNKRGPNHCKVTLDPSDTYTVEFGRMRKYELTNKDEMEGIYWDQLKNLFEEKTGLYLTL